MSGHIHPVQVLLNKTLGPYQLWVRWWVMLCVTPHSDLPRWDAVEKKRETFPGGINKELH